MKLDTSAIDEMKGILPVYYLYPRQTSPQLAYIELNTETGRVRADWNGEIGNAVPARVWHGIDRRYYISCYLSVSGIQDAVRAISDELHTVLNNTDTKWNGSNHVSIVTDADVVDEAERDIEKILSEEYDFDEIELDNQE